MYCRLVRQRMQKTDNGHREQKWEPSDLVLSG